MTDEEMQAEIEESYEHGLPDYLRDDLDNYKKAVEENRKIDACFLWGELYGSINAAQIGDGSITPEQADYLRNKLEMSKTHFQSLKGIERKSRLKGQSEKRIQQSRP